MGCVCRWYPIDVILLGIVYIGTLAKAIEQRERESECFGTHSFFCLAIVLGRCERDA